MDEYLRLLYWTGSQLRSGKRGAIPAELSAILERAAVVPDRWLDLAGQLRRMFGSLIGRVDNIRDCAQSLGRHWAHGMRNAASAFS